MYGCMFVFQLKIDATLANITSLFCRCLWSKLRDSCRRTGALSKKRHWSKDFVLFFSPLLWIHVLLVFHSTLSMSTGALGKRLEYHPNNICMEIIHKMFAFQSTQPYHLMMECGCRKIVLFKVLFLCFYPVCQTKGSWTRRFPGKHCSIRWRNCR